MAAMDQMTPLPTRVNRACDRCRRNKSRCDNYRPCSLCLRANAECQTTDGPTGSAKRQTPKQSQPSGPPKRRRQDAEHGPAPSDLPEMWPSPRPSMAEGTLTRQQSRLSQSGDMPDVGGDSAINIARKIHSLQGQQAYEHAVDAIPGANDTPAAFTALNLAPTASYLTYPLPDSVLMDELLDEYFDSVHWFSLVVLEPKFRPALTVIRSGHATPSEKPFLLLLSTMFGLAAWYRAHKASSNANLTRESWSEVSKKMIMNAELQIVDILDQRSVTAIQTLILLGSYYVYHGRPNLSFSLLGATIKAAQSIGMHQSYTQGSHLDQEERKRVWWTIYTWDRFASVNYGRPLGISEKVCNAEQPDDIYEDPKFPLGGASQNICYSPYQRELNRLYQVASPAIERVYRAPTDERLKTAQEYHALANEVTMRLWHWRRDLPKQLRLAADTDWPSHLTAEQKAYRLQSLALYLTFDSLILILHRPFMKQRLDGVLAETFQAQVPDESMSHTDSATSPVTPGVLPAQDTPSHEHLWQAAVRTARITELPQLAQHATDSHLVVFLAINLFNSAVVLIVMALSDPLTDRAQEAKRAVARVYRVLVALGDRSMLSRQSSDVLRDLVELLIRRESDAILAPVTISGARELPENGQDSNPPQNISVREALSLPLWMNFTDDAEAPPPDASLDMGHVGRLQQGLESVQRAFAGGPVEGYNSHIQSHSPSRRPSIANHGRGDDIDTSHVDPHQAPRATPSDVAANIDWRTFDSNETHWIWNPAWDNLFHTVDV